MRKRCRFLKCMPWTCDGLKSFQGHNPRRYRGRRPLGVKRSKRSHFEELDIPRRPVIQHNKPKNELLCIFYVRSLSSRDWIRQEDSHFELEVEMNFWLESWGSLASIGSYQWEHARRPSDRSLRDDKTRCSPIIDGGYGKPVGIDWIRTENCSTLSVQPISTYHGSVWLLTFCVCSREQ